ncbi:MAG: carboxylesterase family protein [Moraxellaceae bacterium]|nr:carboxylesterase family protein [Moraxellaceae bacterium]
MSSVRVHTRLGQIAGLEKNGVQHFRGIPYAMPLQGLGRIRAPEPVMPWAGVLEATEWAQAAPQDEIPFMPVGATGDACLALNIWRPVQAAAHLPVMVWIHGGGFSAGASNQSLYDGTALARDNGVIVVSINYRLGILGFGEWSDWPELGGVSNAGLRDQLLALQWVQDHIADFGGDPRSVTLFGESAGGMSIACLMASPLAKGLFTRAIIQSGSPDHVVTRDEAAKITHLFAEASGGDPAACLQGEIKGVVRAQRSCFRATVNRGMHAEPVAQFGMTLMPLIGDDILPEHPLVALSKGASADISLLLGTTVDEWNLFYLSPQSMGAAQARPEPDEARLLHEFERTLPGRGAMMLARYREAIPAVPGSDLFCAYETDRMFRIPTIRLAEARFGQPAGTWQYLFDWPCAFNRRLKSCHVMEVPFVFGITDRPAGQFFTGGGEAAERLSRQVRQAWAGFASGSVPAADGWPDWPTYEKRERAVLHMAADTRVCHDPEASRRELWNGVL